MRVTMDVNFDNFKRSAAAAITHVGRGTKKATIKACETILAESLKQVPRRTNTLASSAFYEVTGSSKHFEAIIGYGGNGDPINPSTGERSSQYMVTVHEDLDAVHPVGKAKFLEDPIREFAKENFPRTIINHVKPELERRV